MKKLLLLVAVGFTVIGCVADPCIAQCEKIDDPAKQDACLSTCSERREPGWGHDTPPEEDAADTQP